MKILRSAMAWLAMVALAGGVRPVFADVDFSRLVALGDSFTAGFADAGLRWDSQRASFARLLALQAGGVRSSFEQPRISEPGIPAVVEVPIQGAPVLRPKSGLGSPINLTLPRPYDNLAVPGAGIADLHGTRSDQGGLHDLILRGLGSQLEQALLLEPTFVVLWAGAGDVLRAAVSGVVLDGVTLTPAAEFGTHYDLVLQTLVAAGVTEGVVATVPDVTALPFANSVPSFVTGSNGDPVFLVGPEGALSQSDSVLLTATPLLARGDGIPIARGGTGRPLPDNVVLSRTEKRQIHARIAEYNEVIHRVAGDVGFAVVEAGAILAGDRRPGSDSPAGSLFSLDGIHPSPLGHAVLANGFIEAINGTYRSAIPMVKVVSAGATDDLGGAVSGDSPERAVFTHRAYRNLRFGLGIPKTGRLLRMKYKALEKFERQRRKRLERFRRYKLPAPPKLA